MNGSDGPAPPRGRIILIEKNLYYIEVHMFSGDDTLSEEFRVNFANGRECLHVDLPYDGCQDMDLESLWSAEAEVFRTVSRYQMKEDETMVVMVGNADHYDLYIDTGTSAIDTIARRICHTPDDMYGYTSIRA
jgi:hypothetical protein